ncbi:MAG: sulfotransferase [Gammaproteobacteria bacterium]|nr:sulfotransferase [Gammaproteobacteria bacterium]
MEHYCKVKNRVFIVGCPRSGTTLVQGMLTAHPTVFSLPESFFFAKAFPRRWLMRYFLWPSVRIRGPFNTFLQDIGGKDLAKKYQIGIFQRDYSSSFFGAMDHLAEGKNCSTWVEKTPGHLHCIKEIYKCIDDALFIHVLRRGEDVVKSIYQATHTYPNEYAKFRKFRSIRGDFKGLSIEECIHKWNDSVKISSEWIDKENHLFVWYEKIIADPNPQIERMCNFLGIEYHDDMLNPKLAFNQIVRNDELWKANNNKGIISNSEKTLARECFSLEERKHIAKSLVLVPEFLLKQ